MLLKHAQIYQPPRGFVDGDILFEEHITQIGDIQGEGVDTGGAYIIPGLIDIHTHGAAGADFSDATPEALAAMAGYFAKNGITSFVATATARPEEALLSMLERAKGFSSPGGARLLGVHMEGPFVSPERPGALDKRHIHGADIGLFRRLKQAAGGLLRIVDIAPENEGALAFIEEAADVCRVSLGHSAASYDIAMAGFWAGATNVTHLYNVMPPFLHRAPGLVGAAQDSLAYVEVISDGVHLHPAVVRSVFRQFAHDKIVLVSDSMRAAGLEDGRYTLGGQQVHVSGGRALLHDGTIAGSCANLLEGLRQAVAFGVTLEAAVAAATQNAKVAAGVRLPVGELRPGYLADLVVLDASLQLKSVFIGGQQVV